MEKLLCPKTKVGNQPMFPGKQCLRCSVHASRLTHLAIAWSPCKKVYLYRYCLLSPSLLLFQNTHWNQLRGMMARFRKTQACEPSILLIPVHLWCPGSGTRGWPWTDLPWSVFRPFSYPTSKLPFPGQDCSSLKALCLGFLPDFNSCHPFLPVLVSFPVSCHWLLVFSWNFLWQISNWRGD